ncbi:MAG: beta-lactamase family protein [Opitutaceae bacterium]|nr:beta-lactamase family protein [Opitutaceae bacterium]
MKMCKNLVRSLALSASIFLTISSALAVEARDAASRKIATEMRMFTDEGTTAGLVLLAADRERVLSCTAVGWANIEKKIPMREDALFWIASMTKPVTAVALMMLVDEGKISLDDPVSKYLPEFDAPQKIVSTAAEKLSVTNQTAVALVGNGAASTPTGVRTKPITLRQLLSNTSGLRFGAGEPSIDAFSLAEMASKAAKSNLLFEPGSDYSYSTLNFTVAGRVLEVVTGEAFEKFLQRRIFDPLEMSDTTFWPDTQQIARLADTYAGDPKAHTLTAKNTPRLHYPLDDRERRHVAPGGGLFSTAADIGKFGQMLLGRGAAHGRRLLSERAVAEMTSRQTPPNVKNNYGLGLGLNDGSFGHGGALSTDFIVYPQENLVAVFMVQKYAGWGTPDGGKMLPGFHRLVRELYKP